VADVTGNIAGQNQRGFRLLKMGEGGEGGGNQLKLGRVGKKDVAGASKKKGSQKSL